MLPLNLSKNSAVAVAAAAAAVSVLKVEMELMVEVEENWYRWLWYSCLQQEQRLQAGMGRLWLQEQWA